jgi:hypothetical protein
MTNLSSSTVIVDRHEGLSGIESDPLIGVPGEPSDDPERVFLSIGVDGGPAVREGDPG